ncbi:Receptor kinase-like protein Xa21 [Vitis vinifera]|uniref:non-specific serine/threonine protein kinase n=1 Tax=Vitis vinifera TaxID=29760 RepID=A0A438CHZ3_VITVI|nr:Receptor kinase-like protein Xa21 [Vitis vinifera]
MRPMISHQELLYATNYFNEENLNGKGSLGMVYKGVLSDGLIVCCKGFQCGICKELSRVFEALVLEYMPNGSLEKWLYSHNYFLDFVQRLKIMIDVASGLEYLHHDYSNPVVHCDLKPSNVLLDDDMVAHISDFGIAKLLMGNEFMKRTKTLGTIGYMAPGSRLEDKLLKKPTDEMFMEELTLKSWVDSSTNNIMEVIDANLLTKEDESFALKQACFSSIMTLALDCTAEPPEKRINMKDVVTLRSLTALTGLTGVTAAACCCTSEVVALLKLGFFLGFGRTALLLPLLALHDPLFPRRWFPTYFFLLEYVVICRLQHRDNPLFTAPGLTRG